MYNQFIIKMSKNKNKMKYNSGITIIELLVVISIFIIISGITIFNYSKFKSTATLQNLADDIALSVRRVQGYAIGVKGYNDAFGYSYGIHFTADPGLASQYSGSSRSFILFIDIDGDGKYDAGSSCGTPTGESECLEVLSVTNTNEVSEIHIVENGNDMTIDKKDTLDILFKRPNPEPNLFCYGDSSNDMNSCDPISVEISYIKIRVSNPNSYNTYKDVIVNSNGQISVS